MSIDYSKLRSVTARQFASALQDDGFRLQRQKGSHRHYRHNDGRRVTLSFHHSSDTFPPGTLKSMVEVQAHWTEADVRRLEPVINFVGSSTESASCNDTAAFELGLQVIWNEQLAKKLITGSRTG